MQLGFAVLAGLALFLRKSPRVRRFLVRRFGRSEKWQRLAADFREAFKLVYSKGWNPFLLCMLVYHALIPRAAVGPILAGRRLLTYYFMLLVGVGILFGTAQKTR